MDVGKIETNWYLLNTWVVINSGNLSMSISSPRRTRGVRKCCRGEVKEDLALVVVCSSQWDEPVTTRVHPSATFPWESLSVVLECSRSKAVSEPPGFPDGWGDGGIGDDWGIFPHSSLVAQLTPTGAHRAWLASISPQVARSRQTQARVICLLFLCYFVLPVLVSKALHSTLHRNRVEAGHL